MTAPATAKRAGRPATPLAERFWRQVALAAKDECWLWTGYVAANGYARVYVGGPKERDGAHRVSYELTHGPIPDGLTIDHLCRVRHCVNPAHLEAVTIQENLARGTSHARRTHCKQGHPLTVENCYYRRDGSGHRRCGICDLASQHRRRQVKGNV